MPKAITLILPDQATKKVSWKHQYGCFERLKELICSISGAPLQDLHLLGKTETSFILLPNQEALNTFLNENCSQFSIAIKAICLKLSLPEKNQHNKSSSTLENKQSSLSNSSKEKALPNKTNKNQFKFRQTDFTKRKQNYQEYKKLKISNFIEFSEQNYSSCHVVYKAEGYLISAGFERLDEKSAWSLKAGGKYYIKRGFYSSIIAFILPAKIDPAKIFFKLLGTHADSPCLKLSPKSKIQNGGVLQLDVQTYGGALFRTWFDRELALGGRVTLRDPEDDSKLLVRIFTSSGALAVIPSLPPHLQKAIDETPFNPEEHLRPIIGSNMEPPSRRTRSFGQKGGLEDDHFKFILEEISDQFQVPIESIVDLDLSLADWNQALSFGPAQDFIAASKIDNTLSVWAALEGITNIAADLSVLADNGIPLVIAFDHEEVGSGSFTGADSDFVETTLKRIVTNLNADKEFPLEAYEIALANSLLVSADAGHAFNPNYASYFKDNFQPTLNKGILIKTNDSQRYTTSSITRPILKHLADKAQILTQDFVVRNDKPCGSTIGPYMAKKLGVVSVDVGVPILAMHSIRETAGTEDVVGLADLFYAYLTSSLPSVSDIFW